ncbi:UNVERIFIED_CONTAM: hypothetical protein GTU68_016122 [Idotea baltica]|nr:hypothetical protein [Idotea baltica]
MSKEEKDLGVIAASGGNHGIAVAYVSKLLNLKSKIILPKNICKYRLGLIKSLGSKVVFVDNVTFILDKLEEVAEKENLTKIHPFNHPKITLGTATLGYEFLEEVTSLDLVFVPIGGGGLASGVSLAIKQKNPKCKIIGVEPRGANSMDLSIKSGKPQKLKEKPNTIADSLSSPESLSYSFSICEKYIDEIILVDDADIIEAMKIIFTDLKLVTEPASAICIAALKKINKAFLSNKRIGVIICGSNISQDRYFNILNSN